MARGSGFLGRFRKEVTDPLLDALEDSQMPREDERYLDDGYGYAPMHGGGGMGMGGLPPSSFYGDVRPQWNEQMMDRLIGLDVPEKKDRPKLWLFETDIFRHLQLSKFTPRTCGEIERDLVEIQMLSNQEGNDDLLDEMQWRVMSKVAINKSRTTQELPTERAWWHTNITEMRTGEIKRPKEASGGFINDLIGGGKRGRERY